VKKDSSTNKRSLLINAVWNFSGFAAAVVVAFVMCPKLIHGLGDDRYGIWSLVEATVAYFTLLDLGIGISVVRYVAKFEEIEDREQLNRVFCTTLYIFVGAAALIVSATAGAAWVWTQPFGVPAELAQDTRWLILLLGANVAAGLVASVFGSVLHALGRFPAKTMIETGSRIAGAGFMLAVLAAGGGLVELAVVVLGCTMVRGTLEAAAARRYLPHLNFSPRLANRETFCTIRGYSVRAFVVLVAGRISYSSDAIVIGAFLAPQWITFFVVAGRLTEYVRDAVWSLTAVLTPAISALETRGDHAAIRRTFLDGTRYTLMLVLPVAMGLLILGKPFLTLWLDAPHAEASYPVLVILTIGMVFALSQSVAGRILYGMGQLSWLTVAVVLEAVANILISVSLIGPFGIEGVAMGTAVPCVAMHAALACYVCRLLDVPAREYLRQALTGPLLLLPAAPAVWLAAMHWLPISDWSSFVLIGSMGVMVYGAAVWLVEFRHSAAMPSALAFGRRAAVEES